MTIFVVKTHVCFVVNLIVRRSVGNNTVFLNESCLHNVVLAGRYREVDATTVSFEDSFVYVHTSTCVVMVDRLGVAIS